MKPLHTLNPLHAGAEALAAVGKTEGVRKTTGVSPAVGRLLTNEPINSIALRQAFESEKWVEVALPPVCDCRFHKADVLFR